MDIWYHTLVFSTCDKRVICVTLISNFLSCARYKDGLRFVTGLKPAPVSTRGGVFKGDRFSTCDRILMPCPPEIWRVGGAL